VGRDVDRRRLTGRDAAADRRPGAQLDHLVHEADEDRRRHGGTRRDPEVVGAHLDVEPVLPVLHGELEAGELLGQPGFSQSTPSRVLMPV
jgi:hypothetical protein